MERLTPEMYGQRAALELAALVRHQRYPRAKVRRESRLLHHYVQEVLALTPADQRQPGPWAVGQRPLQRRGRSGLPFIPLAQRGNTTVMLSTTEEAEDLVAFLNHCGVGDIGGP